MRPLLFTLVVSIAAGPAAYAQAPRLTLADAVTRARAHAPARLAASARQDAAGIAARTTPRFMNPTVEWRTENFAAGTPGGMPLDVFATATQPIELGGERAARRRRALASLDAARADTALTTLDLDLMVTRHFLDAVRLRDTSRALDEQVDALDVLVRALQRRVEEGVTAEADLRKLQAERARAHVDRMRLTLDARRALAALNTAMVATPGATLDALDLPLAPPVPGVDDSTRSERLDRRPDVMRARARVAVTRQTLAFEHARRVPDIAVTGGWKRTAGYGTGVLGVTLPVPLFDTGRAPVALAQGEVNAAEAELVQTLALADAEMQTTVDIARTLIEEAARTRDALVVPAAIARDAARSAFASGAADVLRLVDAERTYTDAAVTLHQLTSEAVLAAVAARLALAENPWP